MPDLFRILARVLDVYLVIIIVGVAMSWLQVPSHHPAAKFVNRLTEPIYERIRMLLPVQASGLDFSPLILMVIVMFLRSWFRNIGQG